MVLLIILFLASICHDIKPNVAEKVNSPVRNVHKRCLRSGYGGTVEEHEKYNPKFLKSCKVCGLYNPDKNRPFVIAGNLVTPPNRYPWMVALLHDDHAFCGGSIISDSYILTAAHCLRQIDEITLKIGFVTSTYDLSSPQPIEKFIMHPKYSLLKGKEYDVALIKLKKKITCNQFRNPICLPPAHVKLPLKTNVTYAGWGTADTKIIRPVDKLFEGNAVVIDSAECRADILPVEKTKDVYCLSSETKQTACFGDSGGPLFIRKNYKFFQMGVASFVLGFCNVTGDPMGFISTSKRLDWIRKVTGVVPEKFS